MFKILLRFAKYLVGAHFLLVLGFMITEAIHGINDQDASFSLALLVYNVDRPAVWLLKSLGVPFGGMTLLLAGSLQWVIVSFALGAAYHGVRPKARLATPEQGGQALR
jgi:hypothetical protein